MWRFNRDQASLHALSRFHLRPTPFRFVYRSREPPSPLPFVPYSSSGLLLIIRHPSSSLNHEGLPPGVSRTLRTQRLSPSIIIWRVPPLVRLPLSLLPSFFSSPCCPLSLPPDFFFPNHNRSHTPSLPLPPSLPSPPLPPSLSPPLSSPPGRSLFHRKTPIGRSTERTKDRAAENVRGVARNETTRREDASGQRSERTREDREETKRWISRTCDLGGASVLRGQGKAEGGGGGQRRVSLERL